MVDLKEQLIKKIQETTDKDILEEVYRLLEINFNDEVYNLTNEQKNAIKEAQKQIKKGDYLTEEQANNQVEEWLKKK